MFFLNANSTTIASCYVTQTPNNENSFYMSAQDINHTTQTITSKRFLLLSRYIICMFKAMSFNVYMYRVSTTDIKENKESTIHTGLPCQGLGRPDEDSEIIAEIKASCLQYFVHIIKTTHT